MSVPSTASTPNRTVYGRKLWVPDHLRVSLPKFFNNKMGCDLEVVFPKTRNKLYLHKVFVCLRLQNWVKEVGDGRIVVMPEDVDEELMTEMLKGVYGVEMTILKDKNKFVPMIQLAQRFHFQRMLPVLIKHLFHFIGASVDVLVQCLELDIDNDDSNSVTLQERLRVDCQQSWARVVRDGLYLSIDCDRMKKMLKLIANEENLPALSDAVSAWVSIDVPNRSVHYEELLNILKITVDRSPSFEPLPFELLPSQPE